MKISKRTLIMVLSFVLALSVTAFGTLAYMTDRETVTNNFTIGNVDIIVDEKNVDNDEYPGEDTDGDGNPDPVIPERDTENDYKLIPGADYPKDPTMTVKAGSEECYVRMRLELNCYAKLVEIAKNAGKSTTYVNLLAQFVKIDDVNWKLQGNGSVDVDKLVFEYWYYPTTEGESEKVNAGTEDKVLPALFEQFTVPSYFTGADLANLSGLKLNVYGDAIQTESFNSAAEAWKAFDNQFGMNKTVIPGGDDIDTPDDETIEP